MGKRVLESLNTVRDAAKKEAEDKRDEQIRCVVESTAGMYGDFQGIAEMSLEEIEGLAVLILGQHAAASE